MLVGVVVAAAVVLRGAGVVIREESRSATERQEQAAPADAAVCERVRAVTPLLDHLTPEGTVRDTGSLLGLLNLAGSPSDDEVAASLRFVIDFLQDERDDPTPTVPGAVRNEMEIIDEWSETCG